MIIRLKKTFDIVIDRMPDFARKLSVSARLNGKKSRVPFDKRFAVTGKHGFRGRPGGSEMMEKMLAVHEVQPTGFFDAGEGRWVDVPEMIPEFVVPDLTDFKLKPYVSYKVPHLHQSKLTARELFQATYLAEVMQGVQDGTVRVEDGKIVGGKDADGQKK